MRHGKKFNHLGRKADHRNAMLSNLAISLIMSKRIETTVAKAKALRKYVEPILTRSKEDSYDNRKVIFKALNNKEGIKELYNVVSDRIANRPGGYTRIIKLGTRLGDSADMCLIELVDFNETLLQAAEEKATTKTRRSRRGGGGGAGTEAGATATVVNADGSSAEVVTDEAPIETSVGAEAADQEVVDEMPAVAETESESAFTDADDETPATDAPAEPKQDA
jgi:large subunit ribosomal protein L17